MDVREKAKNDKRLIDANALDERFDKRVEWLRLDVHDQYSLGLYHGAVTDKDLINEMPTVDAVEVVRCKDCKHAWIHPCGYVYCHMDGRNAYEMTFNLDSFCSYGERKEGVENG